MRFIDILKLFPDMAARVTYIDGEPAPTIEGGDQIGTDSSGHAQYDNQAEAEAAAAAAGGVANPATGQPGVWNVSTSNAAHAQNLDQQVIDNQETSLGISSGIADQQIAVSQKQVEIMDEEWQRYLDVYGPVEEEWAKQAAAGLPADYYVGRAASDVEKSYDAAKDQTNRDLERRGIDMSSPQAIAATENSALSEAAAKAGAMTNARLGVNDVNYQRKSDVVKTGRGIPTEAASIGSSASNTLSQAAGTSQAGYNGVSQAYSELGTYYASVDAQNSQNQANQNAATIGAIGSLAGTAVGVGTGIAMMPSTPK